MSRTKKGRFVEGRQYRLLDQSQTVWITCETAANIILGFYWNETKEGEDYWADIMLLVRKRERQAARRFVRNKNIAAP